MADDSSDNIYYGSTDDEEQVVSHHKLAGGTNESELEDSSQSVLDDSPEIGIGRKCIRIVVSDSDVSDEEQGTEYPGPVLESVSGEGADPADAAFDATNPSKMTKIHSISSDIDDEEPLPMEGPAEISHSSVPSTEQSSVALTKNLTSPGPQIEYSFFATLPTGTSTPISISSDKSKIVMNKSSSCRSKIATPARRKQLFMGTFTVEDDSNEINHVSDVQTATNGESSEDIESGSGHEMASVLSTMRQLSLHKVSSGSDGSDSSVEFIAIKRNTKKTYVVVSSESSSSDEERTELRTLFEM